jgi:hypothetical protein
MGRRREMRIGILQTGRADIAAVKIYVRFAVDCVAKLSDGARWYALGDVRAWCFARRVCGDRWQTLLFEAS